MLGRPASHTIDGPVGLLEVVVEEPVEPARLQGLAVIAHPNPLQGGTMDNKVVHTLVRAFALAGWRAVRFNFRGVGKSEGTHDHGEGEVDDLLAVLADARTDPAVRGLPVALAGFSFGGGVAAKAHARWRETAGSDAAALVLVSPAVTRLSVPDVPAHTLVVEGEQDDVVPLDAILNWARPQALPVAVVPGVGHFFHGQLPVLRELVRRHLQGLPPAASL